MSVIQSSAYCQTCRRQSLFQKQRINHVLHLILSIVTLGLWALVWATLGFINSVRGMRCVTCGMKQGEVAYGSPPPGPSAQQLPWGPERP